jgi:hypothetical protein
MEINLANYDQAMAAADDGLDETIGLYRSLLELGIGEPTAVCTAAAKMVPWGSLVLASLLAAAVKRLAGTP